MAIKLRLKGKYGLTTFEGKEIVPCKYDDFTIIEEYDNQVIIFTCSKREQNILKELNQEYNLINL